MDKIIKKRRVDDSHLQQLIIHFLELVIRHNKMIGYEKIWELQMGIACTYTEKHGKFDESHGLGRMLGYVLHIIIEYPYYEL